MKLLAGVDIGGTKTAVVLSAELPHVLWRREFPMHPEVGPEPVLKRVISGLRAGAKELGREIRAIGISCGGSLDRDGGIIQCPPNLPGWLEVPITSRLRAEFGVPCNLENDANAGAVAEYRFGAGRGCRHMIFLALGTGLGAGLILNGQIYFGANAMAGEIGHVRLTETGPSGYGKSGSVEGWASGGGMAKHGAAALGIAIAAGEPTLLSGKLATLTARDIGSALANGNAVAANIVRDTGHPL